MNEKKQILKKFHIMNTASDLKGLLRLSQRPSGTEAKKIIGLNFIMYLYTEQQYCSIHTNKKREKAARMHLPYTAKNI